MSKDKESVFDSLNKSNATLLSEQQISNQLKLACWSNNLDRIDYQSDKFHTLSLYIQGGQGSRRIDTGTQHGRPGSICLFPQQQKSQWQISSPFSFMHLYFSDQIFKQFAAIELDIEPRLLQLPELTFALDPQLSHLNQQLLAAYNSTADNSQNTLEIQQSINAIFAYLLNESQYVTRKQVQINGGLSPFQVNRVKDYVHSNYDRNISLAQLAALLDLSEFHFQRMFKLSTAFSPSEYLTFIRIRHAKQQLKQQDQLAATALDCGFSNQSHFNRVFKQHTGVTPGQYRCNYK